MNRVQTLSLALNVLSVILIVVGLHALLELLHEDILVLRDLFHRISVATAISRGRTGGLGTGSGFAGASWFRRGLTTFHFARAFIFMYILIINPFY